GIPIYYPLGRFGSSNGIPPYSPPGQYGEATPAYSPPRQDSLPNYHHLRIRHDPLANRILWEASTNRIEWTTLYSNSPAFPLTNVQVELFAGTYTPTASPGVAVFDNAE